MRPPSASPTAAILVLGVQVVGCDRSVVEQIPGNDGSVAITLVNPTSCSDCDPWPGLDTLWLGVLVDEQVVVSETFAYPGEGPTLPDLDGFGVVRVVMAGLQADRVVSAGRTALLPVGPGVEVAATMAFLPVNEALPLTASMIAPRSRHTSLGLRDGTTLFAGGLSPSRDAAYKGMEIFDATTGNFTAASYNLSSDAYDPRTMRAEDGEVLFLGGGTVSGGTLTGGTANTLFVEEEANTLGITPMTVPRDGFCVARIGPRQAALMGGETSDGSIDYLKRGEGDTWGFDRVPFVDLDGTRVADCLTLAEGSTFVQGTDAANTGLWLYSEETAPYADMRESFEPVSPIDAGDAAVFAAGVSVTELSTGNVWVGGGAEPTAPQLVKAAREFNPVTMKFTAAVGQPQRPRFDGRLREWITPGWRAWGCGWADPARDEPESTVELLDVERGTEGIAVGLDRVRDGCELSVLPDGALLVTGGFSASEPGAVSAAVVVPWLE